MKRYVLPLFLFALVAVSGCQNENLFGSLHSEGSGDTASLVADAQAALARGEYATALQYFKAALAQDPNNSAALYGAASAQLAAGGLNLGQLLSNLMTQGVPGGAPAFLSGLASANHGAPLAPVATPSSILYNIDISQLDSALSQALEYLETIRLGLADGGVSASDVNVLVNLGLCRVLRAATAPLDAGLVDIQKDVTGEEFEYEVLASTPFAGGDCAIVVQSFRDVAWGYQALKQAAVAVLGQTAGDTLYDLQTDVQALYGDFKNTVQTETGCVDLGTLNNDPSQVPPPTNPQD